MRLFNSYSNEMKFDLRGLQEYLPWDIALPTIYSKLAKKEIPGYKKGKHWYFIKSEIDEWLKDGKIKSKSDLENEVDQKLSR